MSILEENRRLRAKLQRIRDLLKYEANSERGLVLGEIDPLLARPEQPDPAIALKPLERVATAAAALIDAIPDRPWPGRAGPAVDGLRAALRELESSELVVGAYGLEGRAWVVAPDRWSCGLDSQASSDLGDIAHRLLHIAGTGADGDLARQLRELDVVVLVGRSAEAVGGLANSAGAIARAETRDPSNAYLAVVVQCLAGLIDGNGEALATVVRELTKQVELDAAAAAGLEAAAERGE